MSLIKLLECCWIEEICAQKLPGVLPCACPMCAPGHSNVPLFPLYVCVLYSHAGRRPPPCGRQVWAAGSRARESRPCAGRPSAATSTPYRLTTSPPAAACGSSSVPTPTVRDPACLRVTLRTHKSFPLCRGS